MSSETYDVLNNAWKKTCNLLLGEEIGELKDYEPYLKELIDRNVYRKSSISGKEVAFAETAHLVLRAQGFELFVELVPDVQQGQKV